MRKLFFVICIFAVAGTVIHAQDCATGYCPVTITAHHKAGSVAPRTVDIIYEVDKNAYSGTTQCWIARNLGATTQATSVTDNTDASAGWFWQFNRLQGYYYNASVRAPATTWITAISESSDWLSVNDPCTLLFGPDWRLPTNTEWTNVIANLSLTTGNLGYASALKLHLNGVVNGSTGAVSGIGARGYYWSGTQVPTNGSRGYYTNVISATQPVTASNPGTKPTGMGVRCLRTL